MADVFAHGWELHQAGDLRQAEDVYRRVLRTEPRHARTWFALAQLCAVEGRLAESATCFRQALEIEPCEAEGHFLLGNVFLQQNKFAEAEAAYRRCVQFKPDHIAALVNLGFSLAEQERLEEAKTCYEQALRQRSDLSEVHHNLGNVLREQGQLDRALDCYERALRLRPDYAKAFINRGVALAAAGRLDEAVPSLQRGVELQPESADAHTSLGAALSSQHRWDEAARCYEQALALNPQHAEAGWNQSLLWLLQGDFQRGWPAYEWRWRCKRTTTLPAYAQPRWDGSALEGRTILLYGEQGLGDTLQFIRYASRVRAQGGHVIVQCQNALLPLLSRTPGIDQLIGWKSQPPPFDVWAPLMSLPALFGTTVESIPAEVPYVFADPELVAHWRQQLAPVRGFRIGIAWRGSPRYAWDRHRSVTLDQFEPLTRIPGVQLISLQKGPGSEELRTLSGRFPVLSLGDLLDETAGPFMDTAAVLVNLDLVVCVDTALAHLAGAMRLPCWVAETFSGDWRWMLDREDSPWYPTLWLFRQRQHGDWAEVFQRMAEELSRSRLRQKAGAARPVFIEVSAGELVDKIAILRIKRERIAEAAKLRNVCAELAELEAVQGDTLEASAELEELSQQLQSVNERLWDIEDEIRLCERRQDFGSRFIELARSVYQQNDRRSALKRAINERLNSRLIEEKSYPGYVNP